MKVVTINWCYGVGSTGKIILDIEKALPDIEFYHIYEYYGNASNKKNVYKLSSRVAYRIYLEWARISGRKYDTGIIPTLRAIGIIKRKKPDVVHIHCPNASSINLFMLLEFLKKNDIKTIITNHAEFFYTGNCPHAYECKGYQSGCGDCPNLTEATGSYWLDHTATSWKKMYNAIAGFNNLTMVAVSRWQLERLASSPITVNTNKVLVFNGIDTNVFNYNESLDAYGVLAFRLGDNRIDIDCLKNKKIVLQVTASFTDDKDDSKGGILFIELAKYMKNREDIIFIVAGPYNVEGTVPDNMLLLGSISEQNTLSELYSISDVTVITSKRETFGMSCVESLCCGTPVVGFCNGGAESISLRQYSSFIDEYGNVERLSEELSRTFLSYEDKAIKKHISEVSCKLYSKERMAVEYKKIYFK